MEGKEELLSSLNSKVDAMSSELRNSLAEISLECKALREKVAGNKSTALDANENCVSSTEEASVKKILEEILLEMKASRRQRAPDLLEHKSIEVPRRVSFSLPETQEPCTKSYPADGNESQIPQSPQFPVVEIAFPEGEEKYWLEKMAGRKKLLRTPLNGTTMKGRTIEDVVTGLSKVAYYGRNMMLAISISNYSRLELSFPKSYLSNGCVQGGLPDMIPPYTTEVACYQHDYYGSRISGLYSLKIGSTELRLTVQFDFDCVSGIKYYAGLAFTPEAIPVDSQMLKMRADDLTTMDFSFISTQVDPSYRYPAPTVAKQGNFMARVTFHLVENSYNKMYLQVDLMEWNPKNEEIVAMSSKNPAMRKIEDGYSTLDIPLGESIESCIPDKRGCVIDITNGLNVVLEDYAYLHRVRNYVLLPPEIAPFTREIFYASDESNTEGMFSYSIATTNMQLRILFRVTPENNWFAISFTRKGSPTNESTMSSCTVAEPWKIRPHIFSNASDGEQIVEYRNLRLTASMTCGDKAVFRVVVSAF